MYFVYVITSKKRTYKYIGITNNIDRRFNQHNNGQNPTTRPYTPFELVYTEKFPDRTSARKKEKYLKSGIGRELIKSIIAGVA